MRIFWITYNTETGYYKEKVTAHNLFSAYMKFMQWWRSTNSDESVDIIKITLEGE